MIASVLRPPERPQVSVHEDRFPLDPALAQGRASPARVVYAEILDGTKRGRGECVPDAACGETVESVIETIERLAPGIETGVITRRTLARELPAGAARNALDLALWDFDAKRGGSSVWQIAALDEPHRLLTSYTICFDTPEAMAAAAIEHAHRPLLKLRLGGDGDLDRVRAVRAAVPRARLIVDAAAAWTPDRLALHLPGLAEAGVELIEQPLAESEEAGLAAIRHTVPIAAARSGREIEDLPRLARLYDAIAVGLDQSGGFTSALSLIQAARDAGLRILVGCRLGSSLAVAPAVLLAQDADWVDLDAPLLLARDRQPGLRFDGSLIYPASVSLWG
jgi:L-alanine-DL-glutamate epimerase-like enolase superfamily enzyme